MVVRLRLARHGTANNPFYHLVAIADHKPRDALPIEKLGEYDPIPRPVVFKAPTIHSNAPVLSSGLPPWSLGTKGPDGKPAGPRLEKRLELDGNRIKYWLSVGAQPSKSVAKMLDKAGLIPEGKYYKGMYPPPTLEGASASKPAGESTSAGKETSDTQLSPPTTSSTTSTTPAT